MATDIWIHVEYLDRKGRYCHSREDFHVERNYLLFDLMGGGRGGRNPLYHQRGIPADATPQTQNEYRDGGQDFHDSSWLTTMEYRECLDMYYALMCTDDHNSDAVKDWERVYEYMKSSDDDGDLARIVFWFDN